MLWDNWQVSESCRITGKSSQFKPHGPLNIPKNNCVCVEGNIETELHIFVHCNVHCTARTAHCNDGHEFLTKFRFAEHLECWGHVDMSPLLLFGAPNASIPYFSLISVGPFQCC